MNDDNKHTANGDGNTLELPAEIKINHNDDVPPDQKAAADLIRQKVDAAYRGQATPSAVLLEEAEAEPAEPLSKHQQFIYDLTASGKPRRDIQDAWQEYYAGLTDTEKHQVWREFNEAHAAASKYLKATTAGAEPEAKAKAKEAPRSRRRPPSRLETAVRHHGKALAHRAASKIPEHHRRTLRSLAFGFSVGFLVIFVFLFTFFNERFIAPFIQPSRNVNNAQVITVNAPVSTKPEITIPKINIEIPVVYWVKTTDEAAVQDGLDNGVVHYADTALPGQNGNLVIVGHSASNIFNSGKYKFAFSLLRKTDIGDNFYLTYNGKRYVYQIFQKKVVAPTDVSVMAPQPGKLAVATLITCDPPGTSTKRLIVMGQQISPDPAGNEGNVDNKGAINQTKTLPSQSPTLWSRIVNWFTH